MSEISNKPLSEQYRLTGEQWVEKNAAAQLREEGKTTFLSARKTALMEEKGDMPEAKAERLVKCSEEWKQYIVQMVSDRKDANKLKINLKSIEMRWGEQQSYEASKRAEMRL